MTIVKAALEPLVLPGIPKLLLLCSNTSSPKVLFLELLRFSFGSTAKTSAFPKQVVSGQKAASLVIQCGALTIDILVYHYKS